MATVTTIGWARPSAGISAERQKRALKARGCERIFIAPDDTIDDAIRCIRPGAHDVLLVTTMGRLTNKREELRRIVREVHAKQAIIVETTGPPRRSDKRDQLADMLLDAVAEIAGDRRRHSPEAARRYGKQGGEAKRASAEAKRTKPSVAIVPWRDLSMAAEAAVATPDMSGWSVRMAYRVLGPRNRVVGVKAGRPRKVK